MPKFSIIIPAYNVEKYIGKCLDHVFLQTFQDYEVIVVDSGSTDKSLDIIQKYDVKLLHSKIDGVSAARNLGQKKAKGEYLLFLDSDDFWEKDLLKELNESMKNNPDLIRFQVRTVTDDGVENEYHEETFENLSGEEAFQRIVNFHFIESVWCYAIKRTYYEKEKFQFKEGTIHEDFGLTPLIVIKAKSVNSISYIGYNYYKRSGSIMNTYNYEWTQKKVNDFYQHYLYLNQEIEKTNFKKDLFQSYIANSVLIKICELKGKDYKRYKKLAKSDRIVDNLLSDTLVRKVKKMMFRISPKLTIQFLR